MRNAPEYARRQRPERCLEFQLKESTWEKQRQDMAKQIDNLRRKAEQSVSQQSQGEVFELAIEEALRGSFPDDGIDEVAKGVKGGNVTQHVQNNGVCAGRFCGSLSAPDPLAQGGFRS